jgi:MFS family permease
VRARDVGRQLILFRVLQGVGGGMIMPVGQMILADAAGPKRMGRVLAVTGVPTLLGPILGPTIGGLLIDSASWRWIFYVNVPIGIIATVLAVRMLPAPNATRSRHDSISWACCCWRRPAAVDLRARRDRRDRWLLLAKVLVSIIAGVC